MVDLPKVSAGVATSEAPRSAVSAGDIQRNTNLLAGAVEKSADALMDVATRQAKEQAANDLIQQKVVRNADGSVDVVNPANSLIFGRAGEEYSKAVQVGTIAQQGNVLSQQMAELHTKYPTDPDGFRAASQSYLEKRKVDLKGPIGEAVLRDGMQLQTQHFNAITNTTATNDVANQKQSILATVEDQKNTAMGLARQPGGVDSPEFQQAIQKMNASYDALGSNPLFKTPPDQIALEKKNAAALMQGEALVAHVDNAFTKKGKGDAQKALTEGVLQNPNLREVDRTRLYSQGMARLAYLTGDAKATIDANRQITTEMESNLANGRLKSEDPTVGMAIRRAREIGDVEGAQRITASAAVQQHFRGVNTLPDAVRSEVLGVPTAGQSALGNVVNPDIPPEGRAVLNMIAKGESGGRYNVRYGGKGDKTFQDFADHPRVSEPITSGPDVGKNSTAAGRYQFIQGTWDAQKAKLGLKDFSPANQDAAAWDLAQTEYKAKTGKDLTTVLKSGDTAAINEVPRMLSGQWSSLPGGRQPAGGSRVIAPSANGGPGFTAEDAQRNPFLLSAYVRTLAADEELRVTAAKQTATALGKSIDNGFIAAPNLVAEVFQAEKLYPQKMGAIADELRGRLAGGEIAKLPADQQEAYKKALREATDGQDQHQINVAAAALKQSDEANKNMAERPYTEAANRGWTEPAAPIDATKPAEIAPALVQRAALSSRIGTLNQTPPPPLLEKDDAPKLQAALQGPAGAALLSNIGQSLKPQEMDSLLQEKTFVDSVTGMMASKDPVRMGAAMSFVDRYWRDNAANAETKFGQAAITKLQAYQGLADSFSPVELAERLNASDDPSMVTARKQAKEAAETEVGKITPADMAYKMGTSWGIPILSRVANVVTGATPAVPFDSIKGGQLVADYKATYTALRTYGVDVDKASDLAVKRLGATWGVSAAAGNQVMKNPPERSYPEIGGSHDWLQSDLKAWISGKIGPSDSGSRMLEAGIDRHNWTVAGMISDGQTQAEIAGGKPPSYQVAVRKRDGTLDILPSRIAFDPSQRIGEHEASLRTSAAHAASARFAAETDPMSVDQIAGIARR